MTARWTSTATSGSRRTATNPLVTVGKVNTKTGEVTYRKVPRAANPNLAAPTHGIARDGQGNLWFDVNPGRRSLGKVDAGDGPSHCLSDP